MDKIHKTKKTAESVEPVEKPANPTASSDFKSGASILWHVYFTGDAQRQAEIRNVLDRIADVSADELRKIFAAPSGR